MLKAGILSHDTAGGILLMGAALLGILWANTPFASLYFEWLGTDIGMLTVREWINDALMALFFLRVGLEIKRELVAGHLSSWRQRTLPGAAALGGMVFPALIYAACNLGESDALRGWAIPTATDIAFALGVLSLAGPHVPHSLKAFLTALAIVDDLGAVVVIALFYTAGLSLPHCLGAAVALAALLWLNRRGTNRLLPYLLLGMALWWLMLRSGIHATVAGVLLAFTIPIVTHPVGLVGASPLYRLEHALDWPVTFLILPLFGFANAGVSFHGLTPDALLAPVTLGVILALLIGKPLGVLSAVWVLVRSGAAHLPPSSRWRQMTGIAMLCGIGFTMSLFINLLAFSSSPNAGRIKLGILAGSIIAGLGGAALLKYDARASKRDAAQPASPFPS